MIKKLLGLSTIVILLSSNFAYSKETSSIQKQRSAIQKMESETLSQLYKEKPKAIEEIKNSSGYAVFSSGSLAIIWVSAGYGHGVAHNNNTGKDIYMQMANAGVGIGVGAKDYNTVFIFENPDAFEMFTTTGLDLTGTVDAAAQVGEKGNSMSGAADVIPGVRVYQITDTGIMAQAMLQGTKYWTDDELNK